MTTSVLISMRMVMSIVNCCDPLSWGLRLMCAQPVVVYYMTNVSVVV